MYFLERSYESERSESPPTVPPIQLPEPNPITTTKKREFK